jgi:hypothetical protein
MPSSLSADGGSDHLLDPDNALPCTPGGANASELFDDLWPADLAPLDDNPAARRLADLVLGNLKPLVAGQDAAAGDGDGAARVRLVRSLGLHPRMSSPEPAPAASSGARPEHTPPPCVQGVRLDLTALGLRQLPGLADASQLMRLELPTRGEQLACLVRLPEQARQRSGLRPWAARAWRGAPGPAHARPRWGRAGRVLPQAWGRARECVRGGRHGFRP